jgi:hypothetical protein
MGGAASSASKALSGKGKGNAKEEQGSGEASSSGPSSHTKAASSQQSASIDRKKSKGSGSATKDAKGRTVSSADWMQTLNDTMEDEEKKKKKGTFAFLQRKESEKPEDDKKTIPEGQESGQGEEQSKDVEQSQPGDSRGSGSGVGMFGSLFQKKSTGQESQDLKKKSLTIDEEGIESVRDAEVNINQDIGCRARSYVLHAMRA